MGLKYPLLSLITATYFGIFTAGCEKKVQEAVLSSSIQARLGKNLTEQERQGLLQMVRRITEIKWDFLSTSSANYRAAFSDDSLEGIGKFLNPRIKHILGAEDFDESEYKEFSHENFAINLGATAYYYAAREGKTLPFDYEVNGQEFSIQSPRIGILALGNSMRWGAADWILLLSTLAHEARHSDCAKPFTETDLELIRKGEPPRIDQQCIYFHRTCKRSIIINGEERSHPYALQPACDPMDWGANSFGTAVAWRLYKSCLNCTEQERTIADAVASESWVRLNDPQNWLTGDVGKPNLESIE